MNTASVNPFSVISIVLSCVFNILKGPVPLYCSSNWVLLISTSAVIAFASNAHWQLKFILSNAFYNLAYTVILVRPTFGFWFTHMLAHFESTAIVSCWIWLPIACCEVSFVVSMGVMMVPQSRDGQCGYLLQTRPNGGKLALLYSYVVYAYVNIWKDKSQFHWWSTM